jgi:hypothetical protein
MDKCCEHLPTGHHMVDAQILLSLDDKDSFGIRTTNKYWAALCDNKYFWKMKLSQLLQYNISDDCEKKLQTFICST